MTQASVDLAKQEDILVTEVSSNLISGRIGIDRDFTVKRVNGELRIYLREKGTTVSLHVDFIKKLLFLSESLLCIFASFDHYGVQ